MPTLHTRRDVWPARRCDLQQEAGSAVSDLANSDTEDAGATLTEAGRFWLWYFVVMAVFCAVLLGVHAWQSGWLS